MEAPEKIYLYTEGYTLDNDWLYEAPEEFTSFEYTRTDAFIDKACDWLLDNVPIDYDYKCEKFAEDFRKAMKGE